MIAQGGIKTSYHREIYPPALNTEAENHSVKLAASNYSCTGHDRMGNAAVKKNQKSP